MLSEAKHLAPEDMRNYYVYILTNKSGTLYVGMTNNLERRVYQHRNQLIAGFTRRYDMTRLVYYETANDARTAIEREKQIKGWLRRKKIELIQDMNPHWLALAESWYTEGQTLRSAQGDSRSEQWEARKPEAKRS